MTTIKVYGASDDLIEIEGGINEEFYLKSKDEEDGGDLLAFSDGTVLRVALHHLGIWRVTPVKNGSATYAKVFVATDAESDDYSDVVTLDGDIAWAVHGVGIATSR